MRLRRLAGRQVPQAFALGRNPDEICGPPPSGLRPPPHASRGGTPLRGASGKCYAFVPCLHRATRREDGAGRATLTCRLRLHVPTPSAWLERGFPRAKRGGRMGFAPRSEYAPGGAAAAGAAALRRLPPSFNAPAGAGTFQEAAARRLCYAVPLPCPSCCAAGSRSWGCLVITWSVLRGADAK